jgi:acetyl-CoA acetyltransferase
MPLASTKILGDNDPDRIANNRMKTNVNGGAIAIDTQLVQTGQGFSLQ